LLPHRDQRSDFFRELKEMETRAENARAPRIAIAANTLLIPSPALVPHWQRFEQTALIGLDVRADTPKLAGQDEWGVVHGTVAVPPA